MKITMEPTAESIPELGRVWKGVTDSGLEVSVIVAGIGSETIAGRQAVDAELAALPNVQPIGVLLLVKGESK